MNKIITISREFGSGGREIGKRLSEELGFNYYDREIITKIAEETGLSEQYIKNISERGTNSYAIAKSFSIYSSIQGKQTEILVAQNKVLKEIIKNGDCVIVGRGANVILNEYNPMNIFVYADMETKVKRCQTKADLNENLTDKELKNKIIQIDKDRRNYHNLISNSEWGNKSNYHLCINTSGIEVKTIITPLKNYIENWFRRI